MDVGWSSSWLQRWSYAEAVGVRPDPVVAHTTTYKGGVVGEGGCGVCSTLSGDAVERLRRRHLVSGTSGDVNTFRKRHRTWNAIVRKSTLWTDSRALGKLVRCSTINPAPWLYIRQLNRAVGTALTVLST